MPLGPAKMPQEGPKIGKRVDASELPEHKKAEIGDFKKELERAQAADAPPPPLEPPAPDPDETQKIERGVEVLEALKSIHEQEDPQEDPSDPIEEAAEPTDEDKQEFIRCMFGNRLYHKKFALFGGAFNVTLTDLTPRQEELLYQALAKAEIPQGDDWAVLLDRMRLVSSITEAPIDFKAGDPEVELANTFAHTLQSSTLYRTLMRTSRIFQRHLEIMLERSLDSDFWRADGSNLPPEPLPGEPSTTDESPEAAAGS